MLDALGTLGRPVEQLQPETSLQDEASVGYRDRFWRSDLTAFVNTAVRTVRLEAVEPVDIRSRRSANGRRASRSWGDAPGFGLSMRLVHRL